jgi:hypothetical protein
LNIADQMEKSVTFGEKSGTSKQKLATLKQKPAAFSQTARTFWEMLGLIKVAIALESATSLH